MKWSNKHQGKIAPRRRPLLAAAAAASHVASGTVQPLTVPSSSFELDVFSPSWLLDLDCLRSVDLAFEGHDELDSSEVFDYQNWPMNLATNAVSGQIPERVLGSYSPRVPVPVPESYSGTQLVSSIPRELPRGGIDSAIRLIDNWFEEVCSAWSGFDSSLNMNRTLAESLWRDSSAVFKSLQSMSASFLAARLPQMRRPALALLKTATHCIQAELEDLSNKASLDSMPTGTIFSLLCIGTTVCWLDTRRAGWPFLQDAKRLLRRTLQQDIPVTEIDADIAGFFYKSLAYWDMLISFIYDPEPENDPDATLPLRLPRHSRTDSEAPVFDAIPHPWTGVSSSITKLFTKSMHACRTYRGRTVQSSGTTRAWHAIPEVQEAKRIEEELLQLQFSPTAHTQSTGDQRTPCLHLVYVAEAYQLASLLQLYIAFPDLVFLRLPRESHHSFQKGVPWHKWIIPLTLRLIEVLERLPPDSGSRALQPLLYVTAATGLRYGSVSELNTDGASTGSAPRPPRPMESILDYLTLLDDPVEGQGGDALSVPQLALDVSKARSFVLRRLGILKESLHPGPVRVAEELVKAIWAAYDNEPLGCMDVYWIDIMERKELRTLFG